MSTLFYNGVWIKPIYTESCRRRHIYDGPTYLYTRWTIRVRGVFNPAATSYRIDGEDSTNPIRSPGENPAITDNAVRLMLGQARGGLWYTASSNNIIDDEPMDFPGQDLTILGVPPPASQNGDLGTIVPGKTFSDANNGPFPLEVNVRQIAGTKSFNIDFTVQTDVNECYRIYSSPAFVLSNRWEMTHDVDEHAFTVRTVQGRAIFRTDVMLQQQLLPDDFRSAFGFPCPTNFRRKNVRAKLNAAGNEIYYSFRDVEQSHQLIVANVTKIEAWANVSSSQGSAEDFARDMAKVAKKATITAIREHNRATGSALPGEEEVRGLAGGEAMMTAQLGFGTAEALYNMLPRGTVSLNVRVWGNRFATRRYLESIASAVVNAKLPQINDGFKLGRIIYGINASNTYDLMGRFVETKIILNCGPITSLVIAPGAILHGMTDRFPQLLEDDIPGVATIADTPGISMPNGNGMRGSYIETCVAQALQDVCGNPQSATLVAAAKDTNKLKTFPPSGNPDSITTISLTADGSVDLDQPFGEVTLTSQG